MANTSVKTTVFDHSECGKCGGTGFIDAFRHIANGTCFSCRGVGYHLTRHGKADYARWRQAVDATALRKVSEVRVGDHVKLPADNRYAIVRVIQTDFEPTGTRITLEYNRRVIDLALASCPSLPRDMIYHDGGTMSPDSAIYIHPDTQLRNPEGQLVDAPKGGKVWRPVNPRMPKPEQFVTPIRRRAKITA